MKQRIGVYVDIIVPEKMPKIPDIRFMSEVEILEMIEIQKEFEEFKRKYPVTIDPALIA